jgi:hypothetical protein
VVGAASPPRALLVVGGCFVLAALSLLIPWSLAFDPQAWVVWGRDVGRLALDTRSGPSWKPLPVLITTPLAVTGEAAPALWLLFARTGALLAVAGAAALAGRLGGRAAGVAAAAVMALSPWWAYNAALGNSEGILAAAVLWAVVAHLDGRRHAALALATVAALLRPEVWPFFGVYCVWLWRGRHARRGAVAAAAVIVPLLWLGPDLLGIGGAVGASHAARGEPSPGSAGSAAVPALAVLGDAATRLTIPGLVAAIAGAVLGPRTVRLLAAAALAWVAMVALMAQVGYAGNPRYLVTAAAVGCVVAGVGVVRLAEVARDALGGAARRGLAAAVLVVAVGLVALPYLRDQVDELRIRADRREQLPHLIAAAGGREALLDCSRIRTAPDVRPLVAWELDLPMLDLDAHSAPPAVVLRWKPYDGDPIAPAMAAERGRYDLLARAPGWEAVGVCGRAPQVTS